MNKALKKYQSLRAELKSGDIIPYRGTGLISRCIQWADNAYYNHVGTVWSVSIGHNKKRFFTIDAWTGGIEIVSLSKRIGMGGYEDFCIVRKVDLDFREQEAGFQFSFDCIDKEVKYDYAYLLRALLAIRLGFNTTRLGSSEKYVCSEFVQAVAEKMGFSSYFGKRIFTPQDVIRAADPLELDVLYHNPIKN